MIASRLVAIPFTQYLLPDGRKRPISVEVPEDVAKKAFNFIENGGWYEAEILTTGYVSLTACIIKDFKEGPEDIAQEVHENGPGIKDAVKRLIETSVSFI